MAAVAACTQASCCCRLHHSHPGNNPRCSTPLPPHVQTSTPVLRSTHTAHPAGTETAAAAASPRLVKDPRRHTLVRLQAITDRTGHLAGLLPTVSSEGALKPPRDKRPPPSFSPSAAKRTATGAAPASISQQGPSSLQRPTPGAAVQSAAVQFPKCPKQPEESRLPLPTQPGLRAPGRKPAANLGYGNSLLPSKPKRAVTAAAPRQVLSRASQRNETIVNSHQLCWDDQELGGKPHMGGQAALVTGEVTNIATCNPAERNTRAAHALGG